MTLDQLALKYGTDKSSQYHGYTRHYERFFEPIRKTVKNVMEIGVLGGASVKMWRDYFPAATIHGVDIDKASRKYAEKRIKITIGDQADPGFLESLKPVWSKCDIVIDDGGHKMSQQFISMAVILPRMKPGAYYVIEDLQTSYNPIYQDGEPTTVEALKRLIDMVEDNQNTWWVDSMFFAKGLCVIKKQ